MRSEVTPIGPRTHRGAVHFQYETVSHPYPVTSQARKVVSKVVRDPVSPEEFLDNLMKRYPEVYRCLEWVRFKKFLPAAMAGPSV